MSRQERRLRAALGGFLAAFRDLDWPSFVAAFSAGATAFFPFANAPRRAAGIQEITAVFAAFFASARNRHAAGPPYLQLDPIDLQITMSGHTALVTFHLLDSSAEQEMLCRRTFVWIDEGAHWRILHFHASNLPVNASG